jgi:DNA-directed RNA polymerase subunit M/transcription elongation factor TFIIS
MFFCPLCKYTLILSNGGQAEEGGKFTCSNCDYSRPIEDGTVILDSRKRSNAVHSIEFDPVSAVNDLYPRKKIKSCERKGCTTGKGANAEVVVWRDDSFNVLYVCTSCHKVMKPN